MEGWQVVVNRGKDGKEDGKANVLSHRAAKLKTGEENDDCTTLISTIFREANMENTCSICVEPFHKTQRRPVNCFQCGHDPQAPKQCSKCVETYLLQCFDDPKCMHCRVAWSRPFIFQTLPKRFHSAFDAHMRNVLEQRERCLFPAVVPLVEMRRQVEGAEEKVEEAKRILVQAERKLFRARQTVNDLVRAERTMLLRAIDPNTAAALTTPSSAESGSSGENFHRPCAVEDCVGFVSSRTGLCVTCSKTTCLRCNAAAIDKEAHECVEADVATWETLRKETKPCPSCSSRIFKISGCDQMWCPQCHTAFRWSTGEIDRGAVHNPHYYEWLFSEQGRAGEGPRGNRRMEDGCRDPLPSVFALRSVLSDAPPRFLSAQTEQTIKNYHRKAIELRDLTLPHLARKYPRAGTWSLRGKMVQLRVDYLTNRVTLEKFRVMLHRLVKDHQKMADYEQILRTYLAIQSDTLGALLAAVQARERERIETMVKELEVHYGRAMSSIRALNDAYNSHAASLLSI
ncbi:hypothetical protein EBZ80_20665 [bacterium]|nr:hypothetical protein [bacterium]